MNSPDEPTPMHSWLQPIASTNALNARFALSDLLYRTLRRWHCRSTHHRFAIDALPLVQTPAGHRLVSILLSHYDRYLTGTVDPDIRFCDYQNHIIHVNQGYWGGAPRVAHRWYDDLLQNLRDEKYGDAAHAAGVLSHYFVDPLQPLHTMQCARGRIIHRPMEWSISNSYDDILRLWIENDLRIVFQLSRGPGWLGEAILHSAKYSNEQYDCLVKEYDLDKAAVCPTDGLNDRLRTTLAGLFGLSITGWARVLERAAADAESIRRKPLPSMYLAPSYVTATLRIPLQKWLGSVESKRERRKIVRLVKEYRRRGELKRHLPAEVDVMQRVAEVYADELRYRQRREQRRQATKTVEEHANIFTFPTPLSEQDRGQTPVRDQSDPRAA